MSQAFRILNVNLSPKHRIHHALQSIYGIGNHQANVVISKMGIHPDTKVEDLSADMDALRAQIENDYMTQGQLTSEIGENIKNKMRIESYEGQRHLFGLPVRGQRTKSNHSSNRRQTVYRMRNMGVPIYKEPKKQGFRRGPQKK